LIKIASTWEGILAAEQLEKEGIPVVKKNIAPMVVSEAKSIFEIQKTPEVIETLKKIANSGFSPSALSTFVLDPLRYYKQYILKIKDIDTIEETVAANTMGTVVHDVLDVFYRPFSGKYLQVSNIEEMLVKTEETIRFYFKKHYKNGIIEKGKNKLIFKVAESFVLNFLKVELGLLKEGRKIKIIGAEIEIKVPIEIEGLNFPIYIKGTVDRIDELDGVTRIVDYKTGKVEVNQLKIDDFEKVIGDYKYTKALQVMLYAFLYGSRNKHIFDARLEAGIFSFRNMRSNFLRMDFGKARVKDYDVTEERISEFMIIVKQLIFDIFDLEKPFVENTNTPF
jgi:ATP-dependent helicase/DNAse subunit B